MKRNIILFAIAAFLIIPSVGTCDTQTDPHLPTDPYLPKMIARLKELKIDKIEVQSISIDHEWQQIIVSGNAPTFDLMEKYSNAIFNAKIGSPNILRFDKIYRDDGPILHFMILIRDSGLIMSAPAPAGTKQTNIASVVSNYAIGANTPQDADKVWVRLNTDKSLNRNYKVSNEAKKAFLDIYGGPVWMNNDLSKYFKDATKGYVEPIFEERFTDNGSKKMLVLGYITPGKSYFCHACVPLLGGAVFRKQDTGWVVEAAQKIIGWGDVLGTGRFGLIPIGPAKYGIAIRSSDSHRGYNDLDATILVPDHGKLDIALSTGYSAKPGPAACIDENINLPPQTVNLTFKPVHDSDYFDLVAQVEYNDGVCSDFGRKKETTRYRFDDGKYKPVN